jgi:DNA polymerase III alpha subunit
MVNSAFIHLETHSYYTLLASTVSVNQLVARAVAEGMTHLALTDTNVLYGC